MGKLLDRIKTDERVQGSLISTLSFANGTMNPEDYGSVMLFLGGFYLATKVNIVGKISGYGLTGAATSIAIGLATFFHQHTEYEAKIRDYILEQAQVIPHESVRKAYENCHRNNLRPNTSFSFNQVSKRGIMAIPEIIEYTQKEEFNKCFDEEILRANS